MFTVEVAILALTYVTHELSQVDDLWTFVPEFLDTATVCNTEACKPSSKNMKQDDRKTRTGNGGSAHKDKPLHKPPPAEVNHGSVYKRTRSQGTKKAYPNKKYDHSLQQSDSE